MKIDKMEGSSIYTESGSESAEITLINDSFCGYRRVEIRKSGTMWKRRMRRIDRRVFFFSCRVEKKVFRSFSAQHVSGPPTIDGFHQTLTCSLAVTTSCTASKRTSNSSSSSPAADGEIRNRRKSNTRRVGNAATLVILSDLVASHP